MSLIQKAISSVTGLAHDVVEALTPADSALRQAKREDAEALDKLTAAQVDLQARLAIAESSLKEAQAVEDNWRRLAKDNAEASKTNPAEAESYVAKARKCLENAEVEKAKVAKLQAEYDTLKADTKDLEAQLERARDLIETSAAETDLLAIKASSADAKNAVADVVSSATSGLARKELSERIQLDDARATARVNVGAQAKPSASDFEVKPASAVDAELAKLLGNGSAS